MPNATIAKAIFNAMIVELHSQRQKSRAPVYVDDLGDRWGVQQMPVDDPIGRERRTREIDRRNAESAAKAEKEGGLPEFIVPFGGGGPWVMEIDKCSGAVLEFGRPHRSGRYEFRSEAEDDENDEAR